MSVKLNNRQAFEAAWAAACKVEASTVLVPSGLEFVVGPISFSGPYCKPNILFQVKKKYFFQLYCNACPYMGREQGMLGLKLVR